MCLMTAATGSHAAHKDRIGPEDLSVSIVYRTRKLITGTAILSKCCMLASCSKRLESSTKQGNDQIEKVQAMTREWKA